MWHSMPRANEETLQGLTDTFNSSQSDVKVTLVNQMSYDDTFTKYKAGLASGDLPDVVQLQESDQQQMIDTQTVLPASACAKADKYSFSDFLPRVLSYFTVDRTLYAMPFNTSGPVLFYNKKAFTKAGLDPEKPPTTLDEVRSYGREAQDQRVRRRRAAGTQGRSRVLRALDRDGEQALREQRATGARDAPTKAVFNDADRARDLRVDERAWSRTASPRPTPTAAPASSTTCSASATATTPWRSTRAPSLGTITQVLADGQYPDVELGVGADARPGPAPAACSCRAARCSW